eukprot:gnl/TRDRNA2_/TRDRNA2_47695_c0_seq1.p1 gnl/TRDRNA2_/TRDRNA2_47695_c0~~gnl/TRDRNA2_/TRDRNA2_47695_c0_seq1.p1  ORF type:complete len:137 (-),score=23.40 gnl/TRDRNA2_/TRDRNA2_47695_c0_seq1:149-559(-)
MPSCARIHPAFTPLLSMRPMDDAGSKKFTMSGCHARLPRAFLIAVVECCIQCTLMKKMLLQADLDELNGFVVDRSFMNNSQKMAKIEFMSTTDVSAPSGVQGYYGRRCEAPPSASKPCCSNGQGCWQGQRLGWSAG